MSVDFPNDPVDQQVFEAEGSTWVYEADPGCWRPASGEAGDYVKVTGDAMTGPLEVPAGATDAEAPQVQEVVLKAGDTMSGNLIMRNDAYPGMEWGRVADSARGILFYHTDNDTMQMNGYLADGAFSHSHTFDNGVPNDTSIVRVSDGDARYVPFTGGTLTGPLVVANNLYVDSNENRHLWFRDGSANIRALVYSNASNGDFTLRTENGSGGVTNSINISAGGTTTVAGRLYQSGYLTPQIVGGDLQDATRFRCLTTNGRDFVDTGNEIKTHWNGSSGLYMNVDGAGYINIGPPYLAAQAMSADALQAAEAKGMIKVATLQGGDDTEDVTSMKAPEQSEPYVDQFAVVSEVVMLREELAALRAELEVLKNG